MKPITLSVLSTCIAIISYGQKENKFIREENVVRIIKTLSADDMKGRPASEPQYIEKATQFIESEFSKIKLKPLKGLTGYRQEFSKERVSPETLEVTINGNIIASNKVFLASEKTEIDISSGLVLRNIEFDTTAQNPEQSFFRNAMGMARDTSNALIFVDENFKENFAQLKKLFGQRFVNNRKGMKVFVLGKHAPSSYSIKAKQRKDFIKMANVVGVVEGKKYPNEFVVFSAHYDHIGFLKPLNGDSIANGADDDASGTTAVIELARYFKKMNNSGRSLIFIAFTAEEIGGFGSKYFSEQQNPNNIVAMFNIEMIGKQSKFGPNSAWITGFEKSDFGEILQKNLIGTPFQFKPDPYPDQNLFYRSDNATLARLGVPAHTISTDEIDIDKLYHSVDDESESLNVQNILNTIRAIALSSKSITSGKDTPKRIDRSTVR